MPDDTHDAAAVRGVDLTLELPDELWVAIFLAAIDIAGCPKVCRRWRALCKTPRIRELLSHRVFTLPIRVSLSARIDDGTSFGSHFAKWDEESLKQHKANRSGQYPDVIEELLAESPPRCLKLPNVFLGDARASDDPFKRAVATIGWDWLQWSRHDIFWSITRLDRASRKVSRISCEALGAEATLSFAEFIVLSWLPRLLFYSR